MSVLGSRKCAKSHLHKRVSGLDRLLQNTCCIFIPEVVKAYVEDATFFLALCRDPGGGPRVDWSLNVRHVLLLLRDPTPFFVMRKEVAQNELNRLFAFRFKLLIDLGLKDWCRPASAGTDIENCV